MRTKILTIGTMSLAGLVAGGLMALPMTANAAGTKDQIVKRDEDTPDVVLVTDDDDDDGPGAKGTGSNTDTNTNTRGGTRTGTNTNTRTGTRSGRDNSRSRAGKDFTKDGPGDRKVDHSRNQTNDRSRHNTRG